MDYRSEATAGKEEVPDSSTVEWGGAGPGWGHQAPGVTRLWGQTHPRHRIHGFTQHCRSRALPSPGTHLRSPNSRKRGGAQECAFPRTYPRGLRPSYSYSP